MFEKIRMQGFLRILFTHLYKLSVKNCKDKYISLVYSMVSSFMKYFKFHALNKNSEK